MKKTAAVALLLVLVLLTFCGCQSYKLQNAGRKVNAVNHRGYSVEAPENTLAAFRLSKRMGFVAVECDVRFTKDGVPVLLHDETVNRTSNGSGKIRELTLEQARSLDFGSKKHLQYAGEKIPTFEEFLLLCKELELLPYVEVKGNVTKEEVALLAQIAKDCCVDVTWIAFGFDVLCLLANHFENGRFGLLVHVLSQGDIDKMLSLKGEQNSVFLDCEYRLLTTAQIEMCKKSSMPVEVWTVNGKNAVLNLHPYISGVTSDSQNAQMLFDELADKL